MSLKSFFKKAADVVKQKVESLPLVGAIEKTVADGKDLLKNNVITSGIKTIENDLVKSGQILKDAASDVSDIFNKKVDIQSGLKDVIADAKSVGNNLRDAIGTAAAIVADKTVQSQVTAFTNDIKTVGDQLAHLKVVQHIANDIAVMMKSDSVKKSLSAIGTDAKAIFNDVSQIASSTSDLINNGGNAQSLSNIISATGDTFGKIRDVYAQFQTLSKDPAVVKAMNDIASDVANDAEAYVKETISYISNTGMDIVNRVSEIWNSQKMVSAGFGDINGGSGNKVIVDVTGFNKTINSGEGNNVVVGGFGHYNINGGNGDNILIGGLGGNNVITGGTGNDIIWGGRGGNNTLIGGQGIDTFIWGKGDGMENIVGDKDDRVVMYNMKHDALSLSMNGNDLVIGADTANNLTIKDWAKAGSTNTFTFAGELGSSYKVVNNNGNLSWQNA